MDFRIVVTLLGVAALSVSPASAQLSMEYISSVENGFNRPGSDIRGQQIPTGSHPYTCIGLCNQEPTCRAWTYVRPGVMAQGAMCWLKATIPPASADANAMSGYMKEKPFWLVYVNYGTKPATLGVYPEGLAPPGVGAPMTDPRTLRGAWAYVCGLHGVAGTGAYYAPAIASGAVHCAALNAL